MARWTGGSPLDEDERIRALATRLIDDLPQLSTDIRQFVEAAIPRMAGDASMTDLFHASVRGNVETVLRSLRQRIDVKDVDAPEAANEHARRLAHNDVPVNSLIRAYRLGQRRMTEQVFGALRDVDVPSAERMAVLETVTATMFEYIDRISLQVGAVYEEERERWLENRNTLRAVRVRELLDGRYDDDVDAATTSIRYPLRWHHLAVVLWFSEAHPEPDGLARLQRCLNDLGDATGAAAAPLFVAANPLTAWGWLPFTAAVDSAVEDIREFASGRRGVPNIAVGLPAAGIAGFRRSHQHARAAHSVASARHGTEPIVVSAADPGLALASIIGTDVVAARSWVADVLGDLADDEDGAARLRETLRTYLLHGGSYKVASEELILHPNTVKYRVGRALQRRGRAIDEDRIDVEVALLMCRWYGQAVLRTSP